MRIAIVTAGGAGMFCGSCMLDNTLARALRADNVDVTLIPTYTPIRTDEDNSSMQRVFFGGINVWLDSRFAFWRRLPGGLIRWLNSPRIIQWATRFSVSNDARELGGLTVAMLDGLDGPQAREVRELVRFIVDDLRPDAVLFSNILLSGVMPALRSEFDGRIWCTLQGDDIFLNDLAEPWAGQARSRIRSHSQLFDGLVVHSRYYRDVMAEYTALPPERFHVVAPGIDLAGHNGTPRPAASQPFTVGYFARVCPEKGFAQLLDGFRLLQQTHPGARVRAAGYLGPRDQKFYDSVMKSAADLGDRFVYTGSPETREEKIEFFKSLDVLCVPTTYREPKGLYVLEALANGVPVVQPAHGAFPEMVERSGGGLLFSPGDPADLANQLRQLCDDEPRRLELARAGQRAVQDYFNSQRMARDTLAVLAANTTDPAS